MPIHNAYTVFSAVLFSYSVFAPTSARKLGSSSFTTDGNGLLMVANCREMISLEHVAPDTA